jgi:hypothetical protein
MVDVLHGSDCNPRMSLSLSLSRVCIGYVTFEDVRVPAENLIGQENHGFLPIMHNFNMERYAFRIFVFVFVFKLIVVVINVVVVVVINVVVVVVIFVLIVCWCRFGGIVMCVRFSRVCLEVHNNISTTLPPSITFYLR